jgi:hypothetical protein
MSTLATIIQELITLLGNANLAGALSTVAQIATQLLALVGNKNAQRDIQSQDAYNAAVFGSVSAAQYLYHNSLPDSGMPHEDIVDGQFYWAKLATAGWTVVNGTVVAPSAPPPVQ